MGIEERTLNLVRSEVDRILTEADAGADSLLSDLHAELHALATKVTRLEQKITELESAQRPAARARKQSASGPDSA